MGMFVKVRSYTTVE